jgi:acetoin utilization deacetylase AcuC-like enzyme
MHVFYVAYDRDYVHPLAEGHRFPMIKYELIPEQLLHEGVISWSDLHSPGLAEEDVIIGTHKREYWEGLRDLSLSDAEVRRIGFPLTESLVRREQKIVQGTIDGCTYALQNGVAFNIAGGTHHAGSFWGEGFCLLNDQAIAANYLLINNLVKRILIIDLDVHQGNGTAEIFKNDSRVFTFSVHGRNNFPFRKEISDLDIALEDGTADEEYLDLLNKHLPALIEQHDPDFIFYLPGADVLMTDKLGKLNLSEDACRQRDMEVFSQCYKRSIPVQVSMGGGYSPKIRDIVAVHCNTFKAARDICS